MGILNVTPDSFSDGGHNSNVEQALKHALQMVAQGADILDIGGESTRPGAKAVGVQQELDRVIPVIEAIREHSDIPISLDTSKTEVMRAGVGAGANMINDVNALRAEGAIAAVSSLQVPVCLMHMQGQPRTMQHNPQYEDCVADVIAFLLQRVEACVQGGIARCEIALDPGFGFGKTLPHNIALFRGLDRFVRTGYPVMIGVSRKTMIGEMIGRPVEQRVTGSAVAAAIAASQGVAIVRVHDVAETRDAMVVMQMLKQGMQ